MSDTDKTDPYHVKGAWEPRERHDHRDGYCDLPPLGKHGVFPRDQNWRGCYWDSNWHAGYMRCNCKVCRWWGYESEKRQQRYSARKQIREQLADMVEPEEYCECSCHSGDDCCYVCTNDYANYCDQEF